MRELHRPRWVAGMMILDPYQDVAEIAREREARDDAPVYCEVCHHDYPDGPDHDSTKEWD